MARLSEPKIRVGVIVPFYHPVFGGAENQCRALLKELASSGGVEFPFLLTRRKEPGMGREETVDGVRVIRLGPPGMSRWAHYGFYLALLGQLLKQGRSVDLLHCHATGLTGFCVTLAGRLLGAPVLLKLSSNGELTVGTRNLVKTGSFAGLLRRATSRYLCRHASVVALNREGLSELAQAGCQRRYCLPNGVDVRRFRPVSASERLELRRRLGLPETAVICLYTGRFVVSKGIDLLVSAYGRLAAEWDEEQFVLGLVGSGTGQAEAVSIPAGPGIKVYPPMVDVSSVIQAADVFVFPSHREGLPNAVLEALAVGLPCVLSDIEPHLELAESNPAATIHFFPAGDTAALADLLRCVCHGLRDRGNSALLPKSGLAAEYQLEVVAQKYLDLYRELANARR